MYIIENITREVQFFEQVVKILNELRGQTGFDYGTRPWSHWGKQLIKDVYDWDSIMGEVNTEKEVKPKDPEKYDPRKMR